MSNQEQLLELVKKRYTGDVYSFMDEGEEAKKTGNQKESALSKEDEKRIMESEKDYKAALAYIKDIISPAFMQVFPDKIKINNTFAKTFFIYGYPTFLEGNWLSPVINWDVKYDMSFYVYPIESAYIQKYLRKRLTQLNSERSINADK
ncbi:MAG: hypothetical protein H6767_04340 [Candidatus Peribacteria bacterium]|nr:MAG: hypothetical protein H6767_04340 [Candidatus Peribacteria bacterium]